MVSTECAWLALFGDSYFANMRSFINHMSLPPAALTTALNCPSSAASPQLLPHNKFHAGCSIPRSRRSLDILREQEDKKSAEVVRYVWRRGVAGLCAREADYC